MPNSVDGETLGRVRAALVAQCGRVAELDRRELVRVWREWHALYPLEPARHRRPTEADLVSALRATRWSRYGKHAVAEYERQPAGELLALCVDALVGWRCHCSRVPRLVGLDVNLIVTPPDFAWTFGVQESWKDRCLHGGPVFVLPEMVRDQPELRRSIISDHLPPAPGE